MQTVDPRNSEFTPPELTAAFASVFGLTKQHLVALTEDDRMHQTGCAYIGDAFDIPDLSDGFPGLTEPIIETFIVDAGGGCTPTGSDLSLIDAVAPLALDMATRTLQALGEFGVELAEPGYLTASVSPTDQVTALAHLDDDRFIPTDGVGAVAIAGDGNGPRLAIDPVAHGPLRPNLPVEIPEDVVAGFGDGRLRLQQAEPGRIVVFPQFGQLHSGPPAEVLDLAAPVRTLLVFRLGTRPTSA